MLSPADIDIILELLQVAKKNNVLTFAIFKTNLPCKRGQQKYSSRSIFDGHTHERKGDAVVFYKSGIPCFELGGDIPSEPELIKIVGLNGEAGDHRVVFEILPNGEIIKTS